MRTKFVFPAILLLVGLVPSSNAASLVINEWNAVKDDGFLKDGKLDTFFGRKVGNGSNWIELVVTTDHLDIRGWKLDWTNADPDSGVVTFTNDSTWSDLRSGTIITLREDDASHPAFPDPANGNASTGPYGNLPSNTSFNPAGNDWWIHANIGDAALVTYTNWTVDNDDWRLRILDASNNVIQPFIGEGLPANGWAGAGLGSDEIGKLEQNPSTSPTNFRDGTSSTFGAPNVWTSGANSFTQDFSALRAEVPEPSSLILAGMGLAGIGVIRFRRRHR